MTPSPNIRVLRNALPLAAALCFGVSAVSQTSVPVEITATPAGPASAAKPAAGRTSSSRSSARRSSRAGDGANAATQPVPEKATEDSPLLKIPTLGNSLGIPSGTPIRIQMSADIDSAHVHNGDTVMGTLTEPLKGMPAGTPVTLTVVSAAAAGTMQSGGVLSLQVIAVGEHPMLSETMSRLGEEGHKDVADSAPAKGTEAGVRKGETIVLPAA